MDWTKFDAIENEIDQLKQSILNSRDSINEEKLSTFSIFKEQDEKLDDLIAAEKTKINNLKSKIAEYKKSFQQINDDIIKTSQVLSTLNLQNNASYKLSSNSTGSENKTSGNMLNEKNPHEFEKHVTLFKKMLNIHDDINIDKTILHDKKGSSDYFYYVQKMWKQLEQKSKIK